MWLFVLTAGATGGIYKTWHAISSECLTIYRRAGALRACHDSNEFIYYSILVFWMLFTGLMLFGIARSLIKSYRESGDSSR